MGTAKEKREARDAAEASATGKPTAEQLAALNKETIIHPDKVASAHGADLVASAGGAKVFVGCKIGVALFSIQLSELVEVDEQTQTGVRRIKMPRRIGNVVKLRGTAYPRGTVPDGFAARPDIVAGCAINPGIDRDFMLEWLKQNQKNPIVMNRMVIIADTEETLRAMARELASETSGFEPLDPRSGKDPRIPRPTNAGVTPLEPGRAAKVS